MRGILMTRFGPPEVLDWGEVPEPEVEANQVVIRVAAVGASSHDARVRRGELRGLPPLPLVPGIEVAGTVEHLPPQPVGRGRRLTKGLEPLPVGERVVALASLGAYAERVCVPERQVFRIPDGVGFEDAATLPVDYLTAYHATVHIGALHEKERVLIHGASGAVGIAAVQLAKSRGAVVFGTAGSDRQQFLQQIGVDHPVDCGREDFVKAVRDAAADGIEMVLDPYGAKSLERSRRCLGPTGRLIAYDSCPLPGISPAHASGGLGALLNAPRFHPLRLIEHNHAIIGVHLGQLVGHGNLLAREMAEVFHLLAAGQVRPVKSQTVSLKNAAEAHQLLEDRKRFGKVLLVPD